MEDRHQQLELKKLQQQAKTMQRSKIDQTDLECFDKCFSFNVP
jgi:hypothetical protein